VATYWKSATTCAPHEPFNRRRRRSAFRAQDRDTLDSQPCPCTDAAPR
jgi:hypothetical protein